jgi:hypothetical protein
MDSLIVAPYVKFVIEKISEVMEVEYSSFLQISNRDGDRVKWDFCIYFEVLLSHINVSTAHAPVWHLQGNA